MSTAERQANDNVSEEEEQRQTISRRKLLKTLATAGGAVAATTLLPSEWAKPVVEVGVLPVHAQATPGAVEPAPPEYSASCDSTPGGGDITNYPPGTVSGTGYIDDIEASLVIISGTGSIEGITVTMTAIAIAPSTSLPTFAPVLPVTAVTDASGVAHFNSLDVMGTPVEYFGLVFSYAVPTGCTLQTACSIYELH